MNKTLCVLLLLVFLAPPLHGAPVSRPAEIMDSAEIGLALEKLNALGTALYLAAHPDDENTAMISWLSKERQLRTGYLRVGAHRVRKSSCLVALTSTGPFATRISPSRLSLPSSSSRILSAL